MNSNDNPNPTLKKKTKHQKSKQFMANIITMLDISARIGRSVEQNRTPVHRVQILGGLWYVVGVVSLISGKGWMFDKWQKVKKIV